MRRFAFFCCSAAVVSVGCQKSQPPASADTTATAAPAPAPAAPAPAAIHLADVAGKWNVRVLNQAGDSTLLTLVMTTTADSTGWKETFSKGLTVPLRVISVAGDSIVTESGPQPSQLRKGMSVTTHTVTRFHGDTMVGQTVAHYKTTKADSVRNLELRGTKAP